MNSRVVCDCSQLAQLGQQSQQTQQLLSLLQAQQQQQQTQQQQQQAAFTAQQEVNAKTVESVAGLVANQAEIISSNGQLVAQLPQFQQANQQLMQANTKLVERLQASATEDRQMNQFIMSCAVHKMFAGAAMPEGGPRMVPVQPAIASGSNEQSSEAPSAPPAPMASQTAASSSTQGGGFVNSAATPFAFPAGLSAINPAPFAFNPMGAQWAAVPGPPPARPTPQ